MEEEEEECEGGYTWLCRGRAGNRQKGRNGLYFHIVIRQHLGDERASPLSPWPVSMETNSHPYTYSVHPTYSVLPACGSNGLLTCTCDTGSFFFVRLQ